MSGKPAALISSAGCGRPGSPPRRRSWAVLSKRDRSVVSCQLLCHNQLLVQGRTSNAAAGGSAEVMHHRKGENQLISEACFFCCFQLYNRGIIWFKKKKFKQILEQYLFDLWTLTYPVCKHCLAKVKGTLIRYFLSWIYLFLTMMESFKHQECHINWLLNSSLTLTFATTCHSSKLSEMSFEKENTLEKNAIAGDCHGNVKDSTGTQWLCSTSFFWK